MSAPAMQAGARQPYERAANGSQYDLEVDSNTVQVSYCELLTSSSRCGGGCADLP